MFEQIIILLICLLELLTFINSKERCTQLNEIVSGNKGYVMSITIALSILSRAIIFPFIYTCCIYFLCINSAYFDNHMLYLITSVLSALSINFNIMYYKMRIETRIFIMRLYSLISIIVWFPTIVSIIKLIY